MEAGWERCLAAITRAHAVEVAAGAAGGGHNKTVYAACLIKGARVCRA